MKYFSQCKTLDDLKKVYRQLAMKHHPDRGGDEETMKAINNEYEKAFELLKRQQNSTATEDKYKTTEDASEFINIINALLKLDGLQIDLCGCWLWIGGNTRAHKEELKAAGCRWSSQKKLWSWHHAEDGSRYYRGKRTMSEIYQKYGRISFQAAGEYAPATT